MTREDIILRLGPDWDEMQDIIHNALHSDIGLLQSINDSILSHSGKMIRPMMSLLISHACGNCNSTSLRYAAASELLHNATLLHDDVADSSNQRRGCPTVNSRLGSNAAVLIGDYWLAAAVKTVLGTDINPDVLKLFAGTLSSLADGEMLQLEKSSLADTTEEDYLHIIYCKTASLFETACVSGAFSAGASVEQREAASVYARAAGMAFQIKDDILDYAGGEPLGKPVGMDLMEQKITLPLLCALEGDAHEPEIRTLVRDIHSNPDNRLKVSAFVEQRNGVGKAAKKLNAYIEKAVDALQAFHAGIFRDCLVELVRFNSFRTV